MSSPILGLRVQPLTTVLIASWIVVFVLDVTSGGYDFVGAGELSPLERAYGIDSRRVAAGEWWRLVTAGFVHFGVLHLALNAYAMAIAGRYVGSRLGSLRMGLVFLVALIGGGLGAYVSTIGQPTITAGASGGIMGLFGAMVVVSYPIASESAALSRALPAIVLTLLAGFATTGISNGAHIGGLVAGGLTSLLLAARSPSGWLREARASQEVLAEAANRVTGEAPFTTMTPDEFSRETRTLMPPHLVGGFIVALAFGLFAAWTLARPFGLYGGERGIIEEPLLLLGWAGLAFGLVTALASLHGRLVLSPAGFAYEGWRYGDRVGWSEVAGFVTRKISRLSSRTELSYSLVPARAFARRGWFGSFPDARPRVIPLLFGLKGDDQRALMETWQARWAHLNVRWPDQAALKHSSGLPVVGLVAVVAALPFIGVTLAARELDDRVRLGARELMAGPDDLAGATVIRDEEIRGGTGWSREMTLRSGLVARATVFVTVFDTQGDARRSLARSTCDRYYGWRSGSDPTETRITVSAVGDSPTVACRFDFGTGSSLQYSVWATTRNVRIDVLGVTRAGSTGESTITAAVRSIAATQIGRIDRLAPRH